MHGENGTGPAKFNIPHSVTLDSAGRVKYSVIISETVCLNVCVCVSLCVLGHVYILVCMCVWTCVCVLVGMSGQLLWDWVCTHTHILAYKCLGFIVRRFPK